MRELPSSTSEIVCEPPLYRNPFVLQYTSAGERTGCGEMEVSKSSYGFTQKPTERVGIACRYLTAGFAS
jgi:hypothetical protein